MIAPIPKPPITHRQKAIALTIAGTADFIQVMALPALGFGYVFDDIIDFFTAFLLIAVCGFKWQFILAFLIELIPGLDLFPTWTAVVLLMPATPDPSQIPIQQVILPPIQNRPPQSTVSAPALPSVKAPPIQLPN